MTVFKDLRIYRDTRFSKDKTPYHTRLRIVFWEGPGKKTENPGFFFVIYASGARIYTRQHMFSKPILETFRDAVVDEKLSAELWRQR